MAWPCIWAQLILREDRDALQPYAGRQPALACRAARDRHRDAAQPRGAQHSRRSVLQLDANAVCSLTFALAGVLATQQFDDGRCHRLFMYAVFVMPFT